MPLSGWRGVKVIGGGGGGQVWPWAYGWPQLFFGKNCQQLCNNKQRSKGRKSRCDPTNEGISILLMLRLMHLLKCMMRSIVLFKHCCCYFITVGQYRGNYFFFLRTANLDVSLVTRIGHLDMTYLFFGRKEYWRHNTFYY